MTEIDLIVFETGVEVMHYLLKDVTKENLQDYICIIADRINASKFVIEDEVGIFVDLRTTSQAKLDIIGQLELEVIP
jgi:hypothetical protein